MLPMSAVRRVQVFSSAAPRGVRRQYGSQYATLADMHRTASSPFISPFPQGMTSAWLARRWYYTPKSHRAYSVRQISPGDRRLLAEFALSLTRTGPQREHDAVRGLTELLFDRVISNGSEQAVGFAALENTSARDRIIGTAA